MSVPIRTQTRQCAQLALIALGSNRASAWGGPIETLRFALETLATQGVRPVGLSRAYTTKPVGMPMQSDVLNAVCYAQTEHPPTSLLRVLKRTERTLGRSSVILSRAREVDLDLIAYNGRVLNWPHYPLRAKRNPGQLILPHPLMHQRPFVLIPLLDVAPRWVHPVFGMTAADLLRRLPRPCAGAVRVALDSDGHSWDYAPL